ncbi:MAG: hypothetical protein WAT66_01985, partial [Actinomycetota bacterium]
KALMLYTVKRRTREGYALLEYALEVALENDIPSAALRAYYNLADLDCQSDQNEEGRGHTDAGLALARRVGNRFWEWNFLGQLYAYYILGEWDTMFALAAEQPTDKAAANRGAFLQYLGVLPRVHLLRGDLEEAKRTMTVFPDAASSDDIQERASYYATRAAILRAEGRAEEALSNAQKAVAIRLTLGMGADSIKEAFLEGIEAAFEMGDLTQVEVNLRILEDTPRGKRSRYLEAHAFRFRARLAAARGDDASVEPAFKTAVGMLVELAVPFWAAVARLEHAEWLAERGRTGEAQPLIAGASPVFERLRAAPFLERARAIESASVETS